MILSGTTVGFICVIALFLSSVLVALLKGRERLFLSRLALGLFLLAFLGGVVVTLLAGIENRKGTHRVGNRPVGAENQIDETELARLKERVAADPHDVKSRERLGHLYLQGQDYEGAFQMAHEVLQVDSKSVESRVHMGMVLFAMREIDSALAQFDQALQLDPNDLETLAFKGLVQLQGNPKEARKTWERYLKKARPGDVGWGMVQALWGTLESP